MKKLFYFLIFVLLVNIVYATEINSSSYKLNFVFNSGALSDSASSSYNASISIGETLADNLSSTSYKAFMGLQFNYTSQNVTVSAGDTTPPIISNIKNSSISTTSAIITWDTDENANSTVNYNNESGNLNLSNSSATLTESHSLTLTGLTANTTYYYNVSSCDASANCNSSSEYNFSTLASVPTNLSDDLSVPSRAFTRSLVGITSIVNISGSNLTSVYAYLNCNSDFIFYPDYPQNQSIGNINTTENKTIYWYIATPRSKADYYLNITYTDSSNSYQGESETIKVRRLFGGLGGQIV